MIVIIVKKEEEGVLLHNNKPKLWLWCWIWKMLHPGANDQPHHHLNTFKGFVLQQIYLWKRTNLLTLSKSKYGVEQTFHSFQRNKKSLGHQTAPLRDISTNKYFPQSIFGFWQIKLISVQTSWLPQAASQRLHAASLLIRTRTAWLKADRHTRWLRSYVSTGFTLVILRYVTCHFFFFGFHLLYVSAANNSSPQDPPPSHPPAFSPSRVPHALPPHHRGTCVL